MHGRRMLESAVCSFLLLLAVLFVSPPRAHAQTPAPAPWSGVAANEASRTPGWAQGSNDMSSHSLSADGRYILFHSNISTLVPNDNNGWNDVFLRDRVTGELTRVSVASDGTEGNHYSYSPVISADGRYIAFYSCASNFDPTDTNGACDLFVHDRIDHTTTRQSFGPNGEQAFQVTYQFRLSGDGRYLVFTASFDSQTWSRQVYLRDRDPDANGIFDEPGLATTTQISESTVGQYQLGNTEDVAISNDGRYIAYAAGTTDTNTSQEIGLRMYVHDRVTAMTYRVDLPGYGIAENFAFASGPDFSDAGHLAYATSVPLVDTDTDMHDDVYVINLMTGGNVLVQVPQLDQNPGAITYVQAPAISADGRYVAVFTSEGTPPYYSPWNYNVYGVDRQTLQSYLVSVHPGAAFDMGDYPDDRASVPSITADGSGIAFAAGAETLINGWGNRGVFVATDVAITSTETEVPETGGIYTVEVTAPATTSWVLEYGPNATVNPASGTGSATIEVTIAQNTSPDDVTTAIILGSEQVLFHQTAPPQIYYTMPYYGPTSGGTQVDIFGVGFAEGMTAEFGGTPATAVTFLDTGHIVATTPAHLGGWVSVKVIKANGASAELEYMFLFEDTTPPIVTPVVTGTLGANGWYTSDVTVTWTVVDDESEIVSEPCLPFSQTTDVALTFADCYGTSAGGQTLGFVEIKRDATPPVATLYNPVDLHDMVQGIEYNLDFACDDQMSGVASCTTSQGATLDVSAVGTHQLTVTAVDQAGLTGTSVYNYTVKTFTSIYFPPVTAVYGTTANLWVWATYGGGAFPGSPSGSLAGKTLTFSIDNVVVGTAVTAANGQATLPVTGLAAGVYTVRVDFAGDDTYRYYYTSRTLTITKATPVVTWANPSFIVAGTPLGSTQLNATASVAGSFVYEPGFSTVLAPGTHTLNASFTPNDAANYNSATASVTLKVKAIPVITWPAPTPITYLTSLTGTQLNATANTAGSFVYNPPFGTLLDAGTHTLSVTFNPSNTADYVSESATRTIEVLKATATINWPNLNPITYGAMLTGLQLNATTSADGSFTYSPPYGTILNAGTHTVTATFTPNSPPNYFPATATRDIVVNKAYPVVYWQGDLAPIVYGTPLGAAQLYATSPNAGTITYNPPAGTLLDAGLRTISMTFTPDDTANYNTVTYQKQIAVDKHTTTVTWNSPAQIVYGTALSAGQLNATGSQPGTFTYTPPAGTVLNAGTHSLSVYFTPDSPNYYGGTWTTTLVVAKRTPVITWSNPAPIVYGTALDSTQLQPTVDVGGGGFAFDPPFGTVLNAGAGQTLTTTYTPGSSNYNSVSASVTIDVLKATPNVTWVPATGITYLTPLGAAQLNAAADRPGTFAYTPDAGTVLPAGVNAVSTTFTPDDSANYASVTLNRQVTVLRATPVLAWQTPAPITYGTPLSSTQLNATSSTPGTFEYTTVMGAILSAGTHTLHANFMADDQANYLPGPMIDVILEVVPTAPVITWPSPASIVYGTALSGAQLNATATAAGSFAYSPAAGAVLSAGTHPLTVTFTSSSGNYTGGSATVDIVVGKATPVITWANPAGITYGTALSGTQLNAAANVAGTFAYSPAAGTVLNAGTQPLSVTFTPDDSANYNAATANVSIAVGKATPVITWSSPGGINYGTALSGTQLNATANVAGTFSYSPAAGTVPGAGTQSLSVTFTPTDAANYNGASGGNSIVVSKIALSIQTNNAGKVYGEALPAFTAAGTGFVNGDSLASLSGTLSFSTSATTTSAPGSYSVTPSGVTSSNYNITFVNGTLTVTKASTSVAFTTTPNPSNNNQQVQLRAVVSAVAPGAGTATGTVEFREGSTLLGTATLVNGVATMNKNFKRGTHSLTATYVGNTNFNGSVGSVTHQTN